MAKLLKLLWFLTLFAACAPEPAPASALERPQLVAARVTATVKREVARLVRLQTEHGALVTTPEHPFATPEAGWIPAGRLVEGERVVSARDATVRVVSVRKAQRVEPQSVFNLTVAPSHTYVVGTDQVLVHNRKCKDPADTEREIEAAQRELQELKQKVLSAAVEDKAILRQRLFDAKGRLAKLKTRARKARAYRKRKAPEAPEIARITRRLELNREMAALDGTSPGSSQRLAELKRERTGLKKDLSVRRVNGKQRRRRALVSFRNRLLIGAEAEYESRRQALEAALGELSALRGETPQSDAAREPRAERRAALEKKIETLRLEHDASKEILDGERRIAELAARSPSTDAERQQIAVEHQALKAKVSRQRAARARRARYRRERADPETYAKLLRGNRESRRKVFRTADYEADTQRPRDTLELLEAELAARRQRAGAGNLDARTEYLQERIAVLRTLVELRRQRKRIKDVLRLARVRREERSNAGRDTKDIGQKIARLEQDRTAIIARGFQLRLREAVLNLLDGTMQREALDAQDEARLREFDRELEGEPAAGGHLVEERLREIQQELGEADLIDAEFIESLWREAEAEEGARQELQLQEAVQDEAVDVGALLEALGEFGEESPSAERAAALETDLEAMQRELREERSAVEAMDFALANEHAFLSQTLGQPGSSRYVTGAPRLAELEQQRLQIRIDWRARMQGRLDAARQELQTKRSSGGASHEALEAALARRVTLLEHEVNNPTF